MAKKTDVSRRGFLRSAATAPVAAAAAAALPVKPAEPAQLPGLHLTLMTGEPFRDLVEYYGSPGITAHWFLYDEAGKEFERGAWELNLDSLDITIDCPPGMYRIAVRGWCFMDFQTLVQVPARLQVALVADHYTSDRYFGGSPEPGGWNP